MYDLLIKNGIVVDGTGAPRFKADVAVEGGLIAKIAPVINEPAKRILDAKGLIVPKFGNRPENHVAVSMTFDALSELLLMTRTHYESWLTAWYLSQTHSGQQQTRRPHEAIQAGSYQPPASSQEYSGLSLF